MMLLHKLGTVTDQSKGYGFNGLMLGIFWEGLLGFIKTYSVSGLNTVNQSV